MLLTSIPLLHSQSWISSNRILSTNTIVEISSDINTSGEVYSFGHFIGSLSSTDGQSVTSYGGRDYFLVKFLSNGEVDWMRNLGSNLNEFVNGGISVDVDGSVIVAGTFQGYFKYTPNDSIESAGNYDLFVAKFDTDGNITWARNAGTGANVQAATALDINNGDLILAGYFIDSINIYNDITLYSDNPTQDYFYANLILL